MSSSKIPLSPTFEKRSEPQQQILEQCKKQFLSAIKQDSKTLQRYLVIFSVGDPISIREKANISELLGEYLDKVKCSVNILTHVIKQSPNILGDVLRTKPEWVTYLLGSLAERLTLYDIIHKKSDILSNTESIDHRFYQNFTPQDRFISNLLFYCKIIRLYVDRNPQTLGKCLKANIEYLLQELKANGEKLTEELIETIQLVLLRTECFKFFINFFMHLTRTLVSTTINDDNAIYLDADIISKYSNHYYCNMATIMKNCILKARDNEHNTLITTFMLSMQFFPVLLAASFHVTSCKGYLPLFYVIVDTQKENFNISHLNAIDTQVDRITRIIRHAIDTPSCFGIVRKNALNLLIPLIRLDNVSINSQIYEKEVLLHVFTLMFYTYPQSTIIHNIVADIFKEITHKSRKNKPQSICSLLVTNQEQLFSLLNMLTGILRDVEFGITKNVSYVESARIIFSLLDGITRIKDLIKTKPDLASAWKSISKNSKSYASNIDKSLSKTHKLVDQIKRQYLKNTQEEENEFTAVKKLNEIEGETDELAHLKFKNTVSSKKSSQKL